VTGFIADLAHKTRQLVEQNAMQDGLGRLTKSVTFDVKTLDALRSEKGSDEGKVFNLVRGLQKEIDDNADTAPVLQPLKDRAERILKDLENRNTTGLAAMDLLAALAAEKDAAAWAAKDTGLTPKAFVAFWALHDEAALKQAGIVPLELGKEIEKLYFLVNADEQRQLRAALYRPLITLAKEPRTLVVDRIVAKLLG
jgi:type I restriction enzyme, R subunit